MKEKVFWILLAIANIIAVAINAFTMSFFIASNVVAAVEGMVAGIVIISIDFWILFRKANKEMAENE